MCQQYNIGYDIGHDVNVNSILKHGGPSLVVQAWRSKPGGPNTSTGINSTYRVLWACFTAASV